MEYRPKRDLSILLIPALMLGMLALDALILRMIYQQQVDIQMFWASLWLVLSVPLLILAGYWLHSLINLTYYMDRNKLEIRWGGGRRIIPLSRITRVAPRNPGQRLLAFHGIQGLGCQVGHGELEGLGAAWLCVTRPASDQWVIITLSLAYVVSPADPPSLLAGLEERKALGPTQEVEQGEIKSALATWPLWGDGWAIVLILAVLLLNGVLFAHVSYQQAPLQMTLAQSFTSRSFQLPFIGFLAAVLNLGLGVVLHRRERVGAYLLFIATLLLQLFLWMASLRLMPPDRGAGLVYGIIAGLFLSALIGWVGSRRRVLSRSGTLGALLVGTPIFAFGGWVWGLLLIAFFATSSFLSRYKEDAKEALADRFAKGSRRDIGQALANGGLGAVLAIASYSWPGRFWLPVFIGVISAVNADTWATEVGLLSKKLPRLITTRQPVPAGTSGAVSALGLTASALGALLVGLAASLLLVLDSLLCKYALPGETIGLILRAPLIALVAGMAGSLADSLLGATVQGLYYCERCGKETESVRHRCGETTRHVRGWRWLDNDLVNLIGSAVGGLAAFVVARLLLQQL